MAKLILKATIESTSKKESFNYTCEECGKKFETDEKISKENQRVCEECETK